MGKILFQLKSFLQYKLKAINVHHLHSPFAYELVRDVVNDKKHYPDYKTIDHLRHKFKNNLTEVKVTDFGSGAGEKLSSENYKSVESIYRNNSIRSKYGKLLYRLIKQLQPNYILELGTSLGISTSYLSLAAPESKIITIEGSKGIVEKAEEYFAKLNLKNITLEIGNFDSILDKILNEIPQLDFAFIDGNHRKDPTIKYFEACLKKSHNDTVLIFDDIHWSKDMNEAWNIIQSHPQVTLTLDLFQFGIVFFKKELSKQDFIISY